MVLQDRWSLMAVVSQDRFYCTYYTQYNCFFFQVFLCVLHNASTTHLYISEVAGYRFSLSLSNVVYFSPEIHNSSIIR